MAHANLGFPMRIQLSRRQHHAAIGSFEQLNHSSTATLQPPLLKQRLLKRPARTFPRDIRDSTSAAGSSCLGLVGPREIVKSPHIQGDREATPDRAKRVVRRPHRRTLTIQVHGRAASHDFFSPPSKLEIFMSCRSPYAAHKVLTERRRRVARILKLARDGGGIFTHKVKIAHKPLWSMQIRGPVQ